MKDDKAYIDHILQCLNKISKYTADIDKEVFENEEIIQDAVIRNIEIIGEATKKISNNIKDVHFEIPWKEMAGMRDKLIHDYMGVDIDVVWQTIIQDLPELKDLIDSIEK